jgi:DNA-binding transcriptional ArsR family regulator
MIQHSALDAVFHALSDPTRRAIVERLVKGSASISELARPFPVSLAAIGQHVQVLEDAGVVHSMKVGRVRTVEVTPKALATAERWFTSHRARWEQRFDRLGTVLDMSDDEDTDPPVAPQPKRKR